MVGVFRPLFCFELLNLSSDLIMRLIEALTVSAPTTPLIQSKMVVMNYAPVGLQWLDSNW